MRIEILLSTYNGEKYIEDLLDSLLRQTYPDYHITVRDDGSTDSTRVIIERFQKQNPDKITVLHDEMRLGYPDCFWYLLVNARQADMYAFCDQDDVWNENKLSCCFEKCREVYEKKPILYVHDYSVSDSNLVVYDEYHIMNQSYSKNNPYNLIYFVMMSGFAMAVNERLRERIIRDELLKNGLPHDRWIFWCAFFAGEIITDDRLLVTYRRHESTVTITGKGNWVLLKEWWKNDVWGDRMAYYETLGLKFVGAYETEMNERFSGITAQWRMLLNAQKGLKPYFRRLLFHKRLKPTLAGEVILRICFLLNK